MEHVNFGFYGAIMLLVMVAVRYIRHIIEHKEAKETEDEMEPAYDTLCNRKRRIHSLGHSPEAVASGATSTNADNGNINPNTQQSQEMSIKSGDDMIREAGMGQHNENNKYFEHFIKFFTKLGCNPLPLDEKSMLLRFRGEQYQLELTDNQCRIWDPSWASIHHGNVNYPSIRFAANLANRSFGPKVMLTPPNENGDVTLHSCFDFFIPTSADIKQVLDTHFPILFDAFEFQKKQISQYTGALIGTRQFKLDDKKGTPISVPIANSRYGMIHLN